MQIEKFQPSGQRIMPKTSFPELSVYPWAEISLTASETDDRFYCLVLYCVSAYSFSFPFGVKGVMQNSIVFVVIIAAKT